MTLDMQSHAVSLDYRAEPEPRRRSAFGRLLPFTIIAFRQKQPFEQMHGSVYEIRGDSFRIRYGSQRP